MVRHILLFGSLFIASTFISSSSLGEGEKRSGRDKPSAARMIRGRITLVDPAKREVVVQGMLSAAPVDAVDKNRPTGNVPALDPTRDRTGSGRTGNAPARENTFSFKVAEPARITLDGKIATLKELRPDQFVRVSAIEAVARIERRELSGDLLVQETDRGSGEKGRSNSNTGTGGVNTAASPDRLIRMVADRIEAFTKPPLDIPVRPDPPKSGSLGTR